MTAYGNANFGVGNGPILLDDLGCHGNESDILQCKSKGWYINNCGHGEDASVSCRKYIPKMCTFINQQIKN